MFCGRLKEVKLCILLILLNALLFYVLLNEQLTYYQEKVQYLKILQSYFGNVKGKLPVTDGFSKKIPRKFNRMEFGVERRRLIEHDVDSWVPVGDPQLRNQMYSAYFDERLDNLDGKYCPPGFICFGTVKLITIFNKTVIPEKLECNFEFEDFNFVIPVLKVDYTYDRRKFYTYFVTCLVMHNISEKILFPSAVGLIYELDERMKNYSSVVKIRYPRAIDPLGTKIQQEDILVACVPSLRENFTNVLRLVEFIELHKLLGVSRFYFYNSSISSDVDKVLRYYMEKGEVKTFDWKVGTYSFWELFHDAIPACFHDCYYRASFVDNVKYIALLDIDEVMMPLKHNVTSLLELLHQIDNSTINSFSFNNVFMYRNFTNSFGPSEPNKFLYSQSFLGHTKPYPYHDRSKMIAKGKQLIFLSNHKYITAVRNTVERVVNPKEGLLFHYRDYSVFYEKYFISSSNPAQKYRDNLKNNVDQTCRLFEGGVCYFPPPGEDSTMLRNKTRN